MLQLQTLLQLRIIKPKIIESKWVPWQNIKDKWVLEQNINLSNDHVQQFFNSLINKLVVCQEQNCKSAE